MAETLQECLIAITRADSIRQALQTLDLLGTPSPPYSFEVSQDWHRSGAVTFMAVFTLIWGGSEAKYVVKACAPFTVGISVDKLFRRWLRRRILLRRSGIRVPRIYGARDSVFVEDFIPSKLRSVDSAAWSHDMKSDLIHIARTLSTLGFDAICPFSDLMTDGRHIFMVDFGADLGDPYSLVQPRNYVQLANDWLMQTGLGPRS